MDPIHSERSGVGRRNFLQIAAGGVGLAAVGSSALAAPSEEFAGCRAPAGAGFRRGLEHRRHHR